MSYKIRPGTRLFTVKPEVLGATLERVEAANGGELAAEAVFGEAKSKRSPIHGEFVWDGQTAIDELGLIRARQLIRGAVRVEVREVAAAPDSTTTIQVEVEEPGWIWVPPATGRGAGTYERPTIIAQHEDKYQRAFRELNTKLEAAQDALRALKRAGGDSPNVDRLRTFALAEEGFTTVRQAIALLAA